MIDEKIRITDNKKIFHIFDPEEIGNLCLGIDLFEQNHRNIPEEFTDGLTMNPHKTSNSCNLMTYLSIFTKIHIEPDYVLDYIYNFGANNGELLPYARKEKEEPIEDINEYFTKFPHTQNYDAWYDIGSRIESRNIYLKHLYFEKTIHGYLQFGIFCATLTQFYRFGHSLYKSLGILLTKTNIEKYVETHKNIYSDTEIYNIHKTDPRPILEILKGTGKLRILTYSPLYGFLEWQYIKVYWPNVLLKFEFGESIAQSNLSKSILF